ncbi:MAG TPA: hypothetical protein VHE11_04075 [Steroidobacteraceae bacterium]|nr:hypothetical protein [Steroidobacteraceae bacterium]
MDAIDAGDASVLVPAGQGGDAAAVPVCSEPAHDSKVAASSTAPQAARMRADVVPPIL